MSHDGGEFAKFYLTAKDDCLRTVIASLGDRQSAEDAVAEAFARAWAGWRKVSQHPAPAAWVVRTALNLSVSWWRRRRREIPLRDISQIQVGVDGDDAAGTLTAQVIMAVLGRLPARQREVFVLRVFLDLDTASTGEALGIAPGTVTAHMARALAALRAELQDCDLRERSR